MQNVLLEVFRAAAQSDPSKGSTKTWILQELAALSVGGLLFGREEMELREHTQVCSDCLRAEQQFSELVCSGRPVTEGAIHEFLQKTRTKSDDGMRERFLLRARREGVVFSPQVQELSPRSTWGLRPAAAGIAAVATMVLLFVYGVAQDRAIDAKHRFAVWGARQATGSPAQSLGFFYVDDKMQNRWALKVSDPQLVKEVGSVFVTVAPALGSPSPAGPALLYAYLGQQNHP